MISLNRKVYELCAKSMVEGDGAEKSKSFLEVSHQQYTSVIQFQYAIVHSLGARKNFERECLH